MREANFDFEDEEDEEANVREANFDFEDEDDEDEVEDVKSANNCCGDGASKVSLPGTKQSTALLGWEQQAQSAVVLL